MTALGIRVRHSLPAFTIDIEAAAPSGRLALFGPSGSGKTTALKALAGLVKAEEASLSMNETSLPPGPPHQRGLGMIFQDDRLFPHLSVEDNIRYGAPVGADLAEICEATGTRPLLARSVHALSGGERRRVAIARALAMDARAYLLDEPYTGLDRRAARDMRKALASWFTAKGTPFIMVSHTLDDVLAHNCHVALMDHGTLLAQGTAEDVFNSAAGERLLGMGDTALGSGPVTLFKSMEQSACDGLSHHKLADSVTIRLPESEAALPGGYLKIAASDVSIAREQPNPSSILNVLPATVAELAHDGAFVTVSLELSPALVLKARITAYSAHELNLAPGQAVFAQIKSAALVR